MGDEHVAFRSCLQNHRKHCLCFEHLRELIAAAHDSLPNAERAAAVQSCTRMSRNRRSAFCHFVVDNRIGRDCASSPHDRSSNYVLRVFQHIVLEDSTVLCVLNGFFKDVPPHARLLISLIFFFTMYFAVFVVTVPFVYRYIALCR